MSFPLNTGPLSQIVVENSAARAVITLQGGQVVFYQRRGEVPLLWLSETAMFEEGKAIRGGIPICWPWFGAHSQNSSFPNHGFVRTSLWEHMHTEQINETTTVVHLRLTSSEQTLALWPYPFELELAVTVAETLEVALTTHNRGMKAFDITQALHTYLTVEDIDNVAVQGLEGKSYFDKVNQSENNLQTVPLRFKGETDRIYHRTDAPVCVQDTSRQICVKTEGGSDMVVWNPGESLAATMADLSSHRSMLCLESAYVREKLVLAPGESHTLKAVILMI